MRRSYASLADLVVAVHFGFLFFIPLGGILAWRWPRLLWAHVPAVAWGIGIVTIGWDCPLTPLEKHLRRLAGEPVFPEGFIDHYVQGVLYPERFTPLVRAGIVAAVAVGWARLALRRSRRPHTRSLR